jgi:hypothetical protein
MDLRGDVEIKLVIRNREIVKVLPVNDGDHVTQLSPEEHTELKHSVYGLRPVETIYETQVTQSAPKCYIVIGGYKVQVPCS